MPGPTLLDLQNELLRSTWETFTSSTPEDVVITEPPHPLRSVAAPSSERAVKTAFKPITLTQKASVENLSNLPTSKTQDYKIRMLQFARAAILALDYQEPKLNEEALADKKTQIESDIRQFLELLDEASKNEAGKKELKGLCNAFFMHLAQSIQAPNQSYKSAEKQLLQAENILTWKDGRAKQTNISYITVNGKKLKIERSEEAISGLTTAQKREFLERETKGWYKALSPMLRNYVDDNTPNSLEGDWTVIERTIPATLRAIPGLANFTHSTTLITDITDPENPQELNQSSMYRSATATPIDLKGFRLAQERNRIAQQNIEQYVQVILNKFLDDYLASKSLATNDNDTVENKLTRANTQLERDSKMLPFTLPVNSLLNELFGEGLLPHGENNTRFMAELRKAITTIKQDYANKYPRIKLDLFSTSTPVNDCRYFLITTNAEGKEDDQRYISYCDERIKALENTSSGTEQAKLEAEKKLLTAAKLALKNLQARQDYFGDLGLMRAALYEIIIPDSISACKSGKDRLIYKQDYAAALRIYYAAHGHFPDFSLPKKLSRPLRTLGYLGITATALAGGVILLLSSLLPPVAITALMAGAATGAALSLGIGGYAFFRTAPNFETRYDFLKIIRHLRLSGFGALSASANAPGVYGQKNSDIAPDDLSKSRQMQLPFRNKKQLIDLGLYLVGTGGLATGVYFLLTTFAFFPAPSVIALPILLSIAVLTPLLSYVGSKLIQYACAPKLKDEGEKAARRNFAKALKEEHEIAKGNKYKGKSTPAQIAKMKERAKIATAIRRTDSSVSLGENPLTANTPDGTCPGVSKQEPPPVPLTRTMPTHEEMKEEEGQKQELNLAITHKR